MKGFASGNRLKEFVILNYRRASNSSLRPALDSQCDSDHGTCEEAAASGPAIKNKFSFPKKLMMRRKAGLDLLRLLLGILTAAGLIRSVKPYVYRAGKEP
jgi:hypothetical protein